MSAKLQSGRQRIKKPLEVAVIIFSLAILIVLILVIILGYLLKWEWTGFSQKTLWDWLQFFATLSIPIVVVYASARLNHDLEIARNQQEASRLATQDQQRQETLQTYLSKMSELLQNKDLSDPVKAGVEIRALARAWTLMASRVLDANRKGILLQFLSESGLINIENTAVDLRWADFSGVVLSEAILCEANLLNVDLRGAILDHAHFEGTKLSVANLSKANLKAANFDKADLTSVILHGANLENAYLGENYLSGAILSGANLRGADLRGTDMSRDDLSNADLRGAHLSGDETILCGADLSGANLSGADLREVDLSGDETNLRGANLSGVDLTGANLSGVDLTGANLSGAILDKADLRNATVTHEQWEQAKSLQDATMPNGSIHP